ncbi:MAG TPA: tetratricopeptide repeat protein [Gemmatimonadota bacterium]|nr:tetratricopeptide repeat protein [Gemmatimonadota bacterium]
MQSQPHHRLAAVWFADLAGYTRLSRTDEGEAVRLVQTFQGRVQRAVEGHGGRIVKYLGDGALAEFASTDEAIRSASALMRDFQETAPTRGSAPVSLRIGIHVGDVVAAPDGDLYGDGINVAARIQAEAEPGEVWASEDVWRQLRQRPEFRFDPRGERELRGLDAPLKLYAVAIEGGEGTGRSWTGRAPWRPTPIPQKRRWPIWLGAGAVVAVLAIGSALWLGREGNPPSGGLVPAELPEIRAHTVAVLPFDNLSEDPGNEYFADGITDDVLSSLSKVGGLRVISRTSSMAYRGTSKPMREIAAELGVGAILEGSVRRVGDRVRITVQLIDGRTDEHLWAETYDRQLTDVLAIQSEIAREIAAQMEIALTGDDTARIEAGRTGSTIAYDLLLRAHRLIEESETSGGRERVREGMRLLNEALEIDPAYARAWAEIARGYQVLMALDDIAWGDSALAAADSAIERDSRLALAYSLKGRTHLWAGRYDQALPQLERALELDPNDASTMNAISIMLAIQGRKDEALRWSTEHAALTPGDSHEQLIALYMDVGLLEQAEEELRANLRRETGSPAVTTIWLAQVRMLQGRTKEALDLAGEALALAPDRIGVVERAFPIYLAAGDERTALELIERNVAAVGEDFAPFVNLGTARWRLGDREEARRAFAKAEERAHEAIATRPLLAESYVDLARIAAVEGRPTEAMTWLDRAYERGYNERWTVQVDATLDDIRETPAFRAWAKKVLDDLARMRRSFETRPGIREG